jgi:predicted nucleotidyltransferase
MNKLIEVKFGSHLYGTNTENSDTDYKGIYLPTAKEICLNSYKKTITTVRPKQVGERNTKDDIDIEFFSLDQFMKLLCEGQTVALDMLFSPTFLLLNTTRLSDEIRNTIYENRNRFLNKNTNAFVGYTKQQAAKYGVKGFRVHALNLVCDSFEWFINRESNHYYTGELPKPKDFSHDRTGRLCDVENLEDRVKEWDSPYIKIVTDMDKNCHHQKFLEVCDKKMPFHLSIKEAYKQCKTRYDAYGHRAQMAQKNEGIDWKALSHAVRIASEAKELLETGFITFPRPDRELLVKIKTGQMSYDQVSEIIERGLEEIKLAAEKSTLREAPDREWCDEFVYTVYKNIVKEG